MKHTDKPTELNYCEWLEVNARELSRKLRTNAGRTIFFKRLRTQLREAGMGVLQDSASRQVNELDYHYRMISRAK